VAGLLAAARLCAPTGRVSSESPLTSLFSGSTRPNHFSPAWLVSEAGLSNGGTGATLGDSSSDEEMSI